MPVGCVLPADDLAQLVLGTLHGQAHRVSVPGGAQHAAAVCERGRKGLGKRPASRCRPMVASAGAGRERLDRGHRPGFAVAEQLPAQRCRKSAFDLFARSGLARQPFEGHAAVDQGAVPARLIVGVSGHRVAATFYAGALAVHLAHHHQRRHPRFIHVAAVRRPLSVIDRAAQSSAIRRG